MKGSITIKGVEFGIDDVSYNGVDCTMYDWKGKTKEEWQVLREYLGASTIGGSDAGVIMGVSKYKSVYQKVGVLENSFRMNLPVLIGNHMETFIHDAYNHYDESDNPDTVNREVAYRNAHEPEYTLVPNHMPQLAANMDGFDSDSAIVSEYKYRANSDRVDRPLIYIAQVRSYMYATNANEGHLFQFFPKMNWFDFFVVERDEEWEKEFHRRTLVFFDHMKAVKASKDMPITDIHAIARNLQQEIGSEYQDTLAHEVYTSKVLKKYSKSFGGTENIVSLEGNAKATEVAAKYSEAYSESSKWNKAKKSSQAKMDELLYEAGSSFIEVAGVQFGLHNGRRTTKILK